MIINCPIISSPKKLKQGAFSQDHDGLHARHDGWNSSRFYAKMPTKLLSSLCIRQEVTMELKGAALTSKFTPFRGVEIALMTFREVSYGVVKHNRTMGRLAASYTSKHPYFYHQTTTYWYCNQLDFNYTSVFTPSPRGGIRLLNEKNAILSAMIEATYVATSTRKWKHEYIDFPTNWDWHCTPDGTLDDFTVESSIRGSPTLAQMSEANVIVDGVWLNQPVGHQIFANPPLSNSTIAKIHHQRNRVDPEEGLPESKREGFSQVASCATSLRGHLILSTLNPTLQWIIRSIIVDASDRGDIACTLIEFVESEVIPYLRLFKAPPVASTP